MALLDHIKELEISLHQTDVRQQPARHEQLLHPQFVEFGRSGTRYSRAEIIEQMKEEDFEGIEVRAQDFELQILGEALVLLTYRSALQNKDGKFSHHANRSSLWECENQQWQIRFHQGTPTTEFTLIEE